MITIPNQQKLLKQVKNTELTKRQQDILKSTSSTLKQLGNLWKELRDLISS